jgi:hypothetical protein
MCADIAGNSEVQSLDQPAASNTVRTMRYINQVEALILGGILIAALLFFAVLYREDDDWRVAQSVVTVVLLLRNVFLGLVGGVATLLALSLVALLFWDPFLARIAQYKLDLGTRCRLHLLHRIGPHHRCCGLRGDIRYHRHRRAHQKEGVIGN